MKQKILASVLVVFGLFFLLSTDTLATDYYVDPDITDTNVGSATPDFTTYNPTTFLTTGGSDSVYKTIADINACSFSAGDNIYFKKGEVWRENLTIPSSGSSGNPIVFGSYGSSSSNPIITGADIITGWSVYSGSAYQVDMTTEPKFVIEDGTTLTKQTSAANVASHAGTWFWTADVLYIRTSDSANPSTHTIEAAQRDYAINNPFGGKNYITIQNLTLKNANSSTFWVWQSNGLTFQNNTVINSLNPGIWIWDDGTGTPGMLVSGNTFTNAGTVVGSASVYVLGDDTTISSNTFTSCPSRCVELRDIADGMSADVLIEHNQFLSPGSSTSEISAINFSGQTNGSNSNYHSAVVRYNLFENGLGRFIDGWFGDSSIYYNVFDTVTAGATDNGIAIEANGPNNSIYNNTIINPELIGIMVNNDPVDPDEQTTVANNILYASTDTEHIVYVTNDSSLSPVFKNNIYYPNGTGLQKYYWRGTYYTFDDWVAQSGDANSTEVDPLFVSASDVSLQVKSPAIDAGINLGYTIDYAGNSVSSGPAPDIGAYEYVYPAPSATSASGSFSCNSAIPVGFVDLFQIDRVGDKAILYFTPTLGDTERYNVIFGYSEGDERFGGIGMYADNQNQGVQSLDIDHLEAGRSYYFKIVPTNGCAFGSWSNWLKAGKSSKLLTRKFYRYN